MIMEKTLFYCDICHQEFAHREDVYIVSKTYKKRHYDIIDGEYEGTTTETETYHICDKCWEKIRKIWT